MGKRKSGRRREPIRRPIPSARLKAGPRAGADLTEQALVDRWAIGPDLRVRRARPDDVPALTTLAALADMQLEDEVIGAIRDDVSGLP